MCTVLLRPDCCKGVAWGEETNVYIYIYNGIAPSYHNIIVHLKTNVNACLSNISKKSSCNLGRYNVINVFCCCFWNVYRSDYEYNITPMNIYITPPTSWARRFKHILSAEHRKHGVKVGKSGGKRKEDHVAVFDPGCMEDHVAPSLYCKAMGDCKKWAGGPSCGEVGCSAHSRIAFPSNLTLLDNMCVA